MNYLSAMLRVGADKILTANTTTTTSQRIITDGGFYDFCNKYSYFFASPSHIVDNIYLGSAHNAANYNCLKYYDIQIIVNATKDISNYFPDCFTYIRYPLYDNNQDDIQPYLEDFYQTVIQNSDKNILVHCLMGASRSASFVIYYMMRHYNMDYMQALEYLRKIRTIVNPSLRLMQSVIEKSETLTADESAN